MIPQIIKAFIILLVSFLATWISTPYFIKKAHKQKLVVKDMYKPGKPNIANMGGLVMLASIFIGLVAAQFFIKNVTGFYIFYFIVFSFALYGLADDLLGFVKRRGKVMILFFVALPIALLTTDTNLSLIFFELELGVFYAFVFAPIYIMVVANLINMYAGYNGLSLGLSLIILIFASIKALMMGNLGYVAYLLPIVGSMTAFLFYNFYPAKVLMGNVGTFLVGAGVGGFLVIAGMEFFGVIILIPHIINFLMWIYWSKNMHKIPHKKFGKVNGDGTLKAPNKLSMKYLVSNTLKVTEPTAVLICYAITVVFGCLGLVL